MSDETRLTPTFAIEPRPGDPGRYTLVKRVDPVLAVGSDAGTLADVAELGAALMRFAATPTGERRPSKFWHEVNGPDHMLLDAPHVHPMRAYKRASDLKWYWYAEGSGKDVEAPDREAAMLAAEDGARDLLLAGLRVLGGDGP